MSCVKINKNMGDATIRNGNIKHAALSTIISLVLMTAYCTCIPTVFAKDGELSSEVQVDILMKAAKMDLEAERWIAAVESFEKAMDLGVSLPEKFHFLYGKALYKTGSYERALSSFTNYLTLAGRDGEFYEKAITLVVVAENKKKEQIHQISELKRQQAEATSETKYGMVLVKGGCFDMGDIFDTGAADEKPVHTVCVGDFHLGKTEVTQKQWKDIVGDNPSRFECDDCPVERVSWHDVQDFIKKLNEKTGMHYRLPTEAEWEYAARSSGGKEQWAGTSNDEIIGEYAWYGSTAAGRTHAVAGKAPNGIGLYDMMGNVWEWCSDIYDSEYYEHSPSTDPWARRHIEGSNRVIRGGGWRSNAKCLRTTDRNNFSPTSKKFSDIGFRLARSQ
jgi:formylglycine-generating enzyme required for sulfatase activity